MEGLSSPLLSSSVQAILAFITLVSWGVSRYMYKELKEERRGRIQDLKEFNEQSQALAKEKFKMESILYRKIEVARSGKR